MLGGSHCTPTEEAVRSADAAAPAEAYAAAAAPGLDWKGPGMEGRPETGS